VLIEVELLDERAARLPVRLGHLLMLFGLRPGGLGFLFIVRRELLVLGRCFRLHDHVGHGHVLLCEGADGRQVEANQQDSEKRSESQFRPSHSSPLQAVTPRLS